MNTNKRAMDEGGEDIAELETLQIIDRAVETARHDIEKFRSAMHAQPAWACYNHALTIYCAEQAAYYFTEHVAAMDDDFKIGLFDGGQLKVLSFLNEKNHVIPVLLTYIISQGSIRMSDMDEAHESIHEVLSMSEIANTPGREALFDYIMSGADAEMWK